MKTITYSSGIQLSYDDTISVGSLITTYHAGYHVLMSIEPRDQYDEPGIPLFHYVKVLTDGGRASPRPINNFCDASYCKRVTREEVKQQRDEVVQVANQRFDALMKFL